MRIILLLTIFLISCQSSSDSAKVNTNFKKISHQKTTKEKILAFQPSIKPHKLDKLTVKDFFAINIAQLENQILLQKSILNGSVSQDKLYLDEEQIEEKSSQNNINSQKIEQSSFFSLWGITEKKFSEFSIQNQTNIQVFLTENPSIQNKLLYLESLLSQAEQETSSKQDYANIEDKVDQIVSQTSEDEA